MGKRVVFLGFGEAARTFVTSPSWRGAAQGYDIKLENGQQRQQKLREFEEAGVEACSAPSDALNDAKTLLSLVTADQALLIATYPHCLDPVLVSLENVFCFESFHRSTRRSQNLFLLLLGLPPRISLALVRVQNQFR